MIQLRQYVDMKTLVGFEAIEYAEANALPLSKYADPTEGFRNDLTPDEARVVALEDSKLIYVEVR